MTRAERPVWKEKKMNAEKFRAILTFQTYNDLKHVLKCFHERHVKVVELSQLSLNLNSVEHHWGKLKWLLPYAPCSVYISATKNERCSQKKNLPSLKNHFQEDLRLLLLPRVLSWSIE